MVKMPLSSILIHIRGCAKHFIKGDARPEIDRRSAQRRQQKRLIYIRPAPACHNPNPITEDIGFSGVGQINLKDLILFIEEHSGRAIDVEQLKPGVFRNIDTIYRNFFAVKADGPGPDKA